MHVTALLRCLLIPAPRFCPHTCVAAGNALSVPPLDMSALPGTKAAGRVLSPSALGKRTRAADGDAAVSARGSPSKLRGAFQRHQQRSSARGERGDK